MKHRLRSSCSTRRASLRPTNERGMKLAYLASSSSWVGGSIHTDTGRITYCTAVTPLSSHRHGSHPLSPQIQKERCAGPSELTSPPPSHTIQSCLPACPFSRAPSRKSSSHFKVETTSLVTPHHTHRRDNMLKIGIPFMLNDRTGSLSGSLFADLYDRLCLKVRCTHRDSDGASEYAVYNMLSRHTEIPVAMFQYGAGGALGSITTIDSSASFRTHTIATFLVEVGGYVKPNNWPPPPPLLSCIQALM
jgi:hypothetical protein